jgi:hypothetical protein
MSASTASFCAQDVVDLLVDHREVVGDLVHSLLHGQLRHDPGRPGQHRRVGEQRPATLAHELDEALDLALAAIEHPGTEPRLRALPQPVLADRLRGLPRQLHPPARVGGDLGPHLRDTGASVEHRFEPVQPKVLGR